MVKSKKGYLLILFLITISVLTIFMVKARQLWQTTLQRELEQELLFCARQYVQAIKEYAEKYNNLYPESVEILVLEKYLRKKFREPLSADGKWRYVLRDRLNENKYYVVNEENFSSILNRAYWVGVAPAARGKSFFVYKGKDYYEKWIFFVGDENLTQVPEFEVL